MKHYHVNYDTLDITECTFECQGKCKFTSRENAAQALYANWHAEYKRGQAIIDKATKQIVRVGDRYGHLLCPDIDALEGEG